MSQINTVSLERSPAEKALEVVLTLSYIPINRIEVSPYTVPTGFPESDGTLQWNSTTLVLVHAHGGDKVGLGYTYADTATAILIRDTLSETVEGQNAMAPAASWNAMVVRTRNLGHSGIVSMAISAVDIALWDLKARLLDLPLLTLLDGVRDSVPIYGSGGFTAGRMCRRSYRGGFAVDDGRSGGHAPILRTSQPQRSLTKSRTRNFRAAAI
jgi:L-alanine-DL-glutamate epimerase-like enolase superfamily enzyme